ncbi:MAG: chemotaxis protein CheB [Dokdonella sp.]|nr:chemotaxis protein CheB [Dokdonella sp.]
MPESSVPIALLSQVGESSRHVREALAGAGTPIVYEANAAALDRDALEASGARVVVVNLDGDVEAQLDEVYALLDDDRYKVIFNEAQVSLQLAGWEQARWARHLAAKVLGAEHADPPRPADAEPVPKPEPAPRMAPAADVTDVVEATQPGQEVPAPGPQVEIEAATDLAAEFALDDATAATPAGDFSFDFEIAEVEQPSGSEDVVAASDTEAFESPLAGSDSDATDIAALGFGDLDDFAGDSGVEDGIGFVADEPTQPRPHDESAFGFDLDPIDEAPATVAPPPQDVAAELVASAEAIDRAASARDGLVELVLLDLDWADAPAPPAREEAPEAVVVPPPPVSHEAFSWTLSEVDGEEAAETAAPPPDAKADFGIETISAAEYLAPEAEPAAEETAEPASFSLELVPLEEAVAPQPRDAAPAHESWMDTAAVKIAVRRVIVLGASIGGPEAVREFLAHIPKDYPALFLLAQHMGAEFVDLMAQQLTKATSLTVRMPSHGERVGHGDIVIVPIDRRLRIDAEGVVVLEPLDEQQPAYSPSIDQLLVDVADRFGAKASAIVFSGMAEDAAEGSRILVAKGGRVYVQDPETCVISSMVDGVLETGVASFTGSPQELAERVLAERGAPSNS